MKRSIWVTGLFVLGFGAVNWLGAEPPKRADDKPPAPRPRVDAAHFCAALRQPLTIDKPIDNLPLREALDYLSEKYDVTFLVNEKAFEEEGAKAILEQQARLPKMLGVNLNTGLRYLLEPFNAVALVRSDHIEIVPVARAVGEVANGLVSLNATPLVHTILKQTPLDKAVADLAEMAEKNVVLDRRAVEKEMPAVSARLLNVPVDTAVRVVADLAGLRVAVLGNVYYVSTKERVEAMEAEHAKTMQIRNAAATPRGGM